MQGEGEVASVSGLVMQTMWRKGVWCVAIDGTDEVPILLCSGCGVGKPENSRNPDHQIVLFATGREVGDEQPDFLCGVCTQQLNHLAYDDAWSSPGPCAHEEDGDVDEFQMWLDTQTTSEPNARNQDTAETCNVTVVDVLFPVGW
jgi:hypothetical protein